MAKSSIDQLIICNPYIEPTHHWFYDHSKLGFIKKEGRRRAGYMVAPKSQDGYGEYKELLLAQEIRLRVAKWREAGYPGVTSITKTLLDYWNDRQFGSDDLRPYFFCQKEAIETLIWLTEAAATEKVGIDIPSDGGGFTRWCTKMATGTGKTIVMSMIIAWNFANKVRYKQDTRFSKNVLIVTPNLTVKERLNVLDPTNEENYYDMFNILPDSLRSTLNEGKLKIVNWHMLAWDSQEALDNKKIKSVDQRRKTAISDAVYRKSVLGDLAKAEDLIVINDEAHHAWRVPPKGKAPGKSAEEIKEATVWVAGLDRLNTSAKSKKGILRCFDLSATPFAPTGGKSGEDTLFEWIVSDFNLYDAIESGLVKTPRVVVRSDDKTLSEGLKSKLFHLYSDPDVYQSLKLKDEKAPLPALLTNAYLLLGQDWLNTYQQWKKNGSQVPPVMISVTNTTETAARIKNAFIEKAIPITELGEEKYLIQIDSKIMNDTQALQANDDNGDEDDDKGSKKSKESKLRDKVNTTGKVGKPGQHLRNIVSVAMLSEGWDASNVTQIMGLRAFSSQLLCEQVIGRGLRRMDYDVDPKTMLLKPDYVNVFGIPFSFLPFEGDGTSADGAQPTKTSILIMPDDNKIEHKIIFPNIKQIQIVIKNKLHIDWQKLAPLPINTTTFISTAHLEGIIEGKPSYKDYTSIELSSIIKNFRLQTIIFNALRSLKNRLITKDWRDAEHIFLLQLLELVEKFINSDKLEIHDADFKRGTDKWKALIMLNMGNIIEHLKTFINITQGQAFEIIYNDPKNIYRSTSDLQTWHTSKKVINLSKTHINFIPIDSKLEAIEAEILENSSLVESFVKNDHLHFAIWYTWEGQSRRYYPDFLVKLTNGRMLVLETKGVDDEQNRIKRKALQEWIIAVNANHKDQDWYEAISFKPEDLPGILESVYKLTRQ